MNALNYGPPPSFQPRPPRPPEQHAQVTAAAQRDTARATVRFLSVHAVGWSVVAVLPLLTGSALATRVAGGPTVGLLLFALLGLSVPVSSWWFYRVTRQHSAPAGSGEGAAASPSRSGR